MSRITSRSLIITLIVFAFTATVVNANWGSGFGFFLSAPEEAMKERSSAASQPLVMTTPLNAVTSFDGAMIARQIAGVSTLSSNAQKCGADASNNGNLSSVDLSLIAHYVTSGVVTGVTGTTVAAPCHANWPTTVDVLKGDVTGQDPPISMGHGSVDVALPTMNAPPGTIIIPITVSDVTGLDIFSYDFQLTYDPAVIQPAFWDPTHDNTLQTGTLSSYVYINPNVIYPGHMMVSGIYAGPSSTMTTGLTGSGTLINIPFNVVGSAGQSTALTFENYTTSDSRAHEGFLFNEGQASAVTTNGTVNVFAPTAPLNAITSFDAAVMARHIVGSSTLPTNDHKCAADVTANGAISANDAALISRYVLSLGPPYGLTGTVVSAPCHANWPTTIPVLEGDITGQNPVITFGHGSANVSLPVISPPPGIVSIPVTVGDMTGLDIFSYDFQVTFDPSILQPAPTPSGGDPQLGTVSQYSNFYLNSSNSGHLIVSVFRSSMFTGSGTLINLRFNVIGSAGQSTALTFEDYTSPDSRAHQGFLFNEGQAVAVTTNGSVTVAPSGITGKVTYGNVIGGPTPAPRFVPNVVFSSTVGSPGVAGLSDGSGDYWLSGFGSGSYTVTPSKTGGVNNAINSFDAARIAQHVSGTAFLTANQLVAADASGNGAVSSFDAAQVAAFVAGTASSGFAGTWKMLPAQRSYASVGSYFVGEDYSAFLLGEVSGNWTIDGSLSSRGTNGLGRPIGVSAPRLAASPDGDVLIPVSIHGAAKKGIISYEFDLRYDPNVIQPQEVVADIAGTVSGGLSVVTNAKEPGLLRVVVYGPIPVNEDGVLLNLRFTAVGKSGSVSPLSFERIMFNEGEPRVNTIGGQVEVF